MTGFHYHPFPGEEREGYVRKVPDRVLISRLIKYFFPYRKRLALILTAIIAVSVTGLLGPYLLKMAIDTYITQGNLIGLSLLSLIYIGITLVNWLSDSLRTYQLGWVGEKMLFEMREQMFSRLQELSFSFYDQSEMGEIMSRVTNDTDSIGEAFISGVVSIISDIFSLVGIIAIMFFMSVPLTLVSLSVTPLILVISLLFQSRFRSAYRKTRTKIAGVTSRLQEGISGIREIQSFSRERDTMMDFRQANIENLQATLQATKVQGIFQPVIQMIGTAGIFIVLVYGGMLLMEGTLTVGTLIAFLLYIQRFFNPIFDLANFYNTVQGAMAAAERIFEVIDTEPQIKDASNAVELPSIRGEISFENVTFGYEPAYPVLHNMNFSVKPKETIALVGPTGAGKSTIIKLLSRFYELQSGAIKIDGNDVQKVTQESLRKQMGTVLQENFLFAGTIMENIRYGRLDATDEEVIKAAERVGAHDFIMRLPNGYNTEIRERGQGLSVGQKQLIAFARALLRDPPLLILDEATSSIDPYTELIIKRALAILLKDRTSFVIAHRLSTVRNADRILVIDNGKIVEEGSHRQLMRRGGLYRRLYEMQFKEPEELAVTPMVAVPNPASKVP